MTRPFLSAKGVACETNEHKQEFYIVSQARLTSFLKNEKGWINCAYKLCPATSYSAVTVLVNLVPRLFFVAPGEKLGLVNRLFHFRSNGPECWSIVLECLTALKIAFHIV